MYYQCAKKLWALSQLVAEKVMVLDSDFLLSRPVNLPQLMEAYARILFESDANNPIDKGVLLNVNRLLGTTYSIFPMDLPWIFEPKYVRELLAWLQTRFSRSAAARNLVPSRSGHLGIDAILKLKVHIFEIVLYNLYMLKTHRRHFARRLAPRWSVEQRRDMARGLSPGLLFEARLSLTERARYMPTPPPGTTRAAIAAGACCSDCWLLAHLDRSVCKLERSNPCLPNVTGLGASLLMEEDGASQLPPGPPCVKNASLPHSCFLPAWGWKTYRMERPSTSAKRPSGKGAIKGASLASFDYVGAGHCTDGLFCGDWDGYHATVHRCEAKCRSEARCA